MGPSSSALGQPHCGSIGIMPLALTLLHPDRLNLHESSHHGVHLHQLCLWCIRLIKLPESSNTLTSFHFVHSVWICWEVFASQFCFKQSLLLGRGISYGLEHTISIQCHYFLALSSLIGLAHSRWKSKLNELAKAPGSTSLATSSWLLLCS